MKKLFYKIAKKALNWALGEIYNAVDKDKDGKLDYQELEEMVIMLREFASKLKKQLKWKSRTPNLPFA